MSHFDRDPIELRQLRESIHRFSTDTSRQGRTMIRLGWAIAVLTFVMLLGLGVQIWLTLWAR